MKDSFIIKQDVTLSEYYSIMLNHYVSSPMIRRLFLFISILSIFSIVFRAATDDHGYNIIFFLMDILPLIVLTLFFGAGGLLLSFIIYKSKPHLFHNVSYEFTHWGIVRYGEKTEFSKPWRDITRYKETKAFFIFFIGKTDLHFLQKRMFADETELDDFRNFLKDKMNC